MPYRVQATFQAEDMTHPDLSQHRHASSHASRSEAVRRAEALCKRLEIELEDGVNAVVEVIDTDGNAVIWHRATRTLD